MSDRLSFDFNMGRASSGGARKNSGPLRLLVLGDFSARSNAAKAPLASRATLRIDLDNFDATLARLAPRLVLEQGDIQFNSLDDFHPDALYRQLPLFASLREARQQPVASHQDLLGRLLGKPESAAAPAPAAPLTGIDALIQRVVAPHIVKDDSAQVKQMQATVDGAIAQQMGAVLHAPEFQTLEANWRGLHWLLSNLDLDEELQLHVLDVSRDELLADIVGAHGQLAQTGLYRALADRWRNVPGGQGWSLITGLFNFGHGDADVGLLAALGLIASQAGGPFIAAGDLALVTQTDEPQAAGWQALRGSEAAPWIGLVAPRLLLRHPYGKGRDPVDAFNYEEVSTASAPEHEHFLWGNGALAAALLIGQSFTQSGWDMTPGDLREVTDLPAFTYDDSGERTLKPCAEYNLGEQAGLGLLASGLMPLMSHRHRNAATLMRFQSIAQPAQPLAGLGHGGA